MGRFRLGTRGLVAAVLVACVILALNVFLLGKLALVLVAGYVAEWLLGRALAAPRRRIESDPARTLRGLPWCM